MDQKIKESEQIIKQTKKKLARTFKEKVKINVLFKSTKISFFASNKDKIPLLSNSMVVYEYSYSGCSERYIGKQGGSGTNCWNPSPFF